MRRFLPFLILLILSACKVEQHYFQQAFKSEGSNLNEGDTLIFPFKGKANPYQYWKGDLIAFRSNGELKINELGTWQQYNPENIQEIWTTLIWDSEGRNLVIMSKVHNTETDELRNIVNCNDTTINNIELRKCDYKYFFDDGTLKQQYSIITFENPDTGKKYGNETTYNTDGTVKSTELHEPEINSQTIK